MRSLRWDIQFGQQLPKVLPIAQRIEIRVGLQVVDIVITKLDGLAQVLHRQPAILLEGHRWMFL